METDRPIVLVAASGLAREAVVAARVAGIEVVGCLDDNSAWRGSELAPGVPVLGTTDEIIAHPDVDVLVCAGKGVVRQQIADRLASLGVNDDRLATLVHPSVTVPSGCTVGPGTILLAGVVLTADVSVGRHVVCMPNAVLTHDCRLEDYATVCAGAVIGGGVVVKRAAYLGMACSVREYTTIGAESVVGMGSVVLRDVPAGQTWVGSPARQLPAPTQEG